MAEFNEVITSDHTLPLTAPTLDLPEGSLPEKPTVSDECLREHAQALSAEWELTSGGEVEAGLPERLKRLGERLNVRLRACAAIANNQELTPQLELLESTRMLETVLTTIEGAKDQFARLPHVRPAPSEHLPRVMNLAEGYLSSAGGVWSAESLSVYVEQAQRRDPLLLAEVLLLPPALKLAQFEYILDRADEAFAAGPLPPIEQSPFSASLHSLRRLNQFEWRTVLEPLVAFDAILRQDPSRAFSRMEEENRGAYRMRVAELASHADFGEVQTAQTALDLALEATRRTEDDPRRSQRTAHIGYYLFEEGFAQLAERIGYHPPLMERVRNHIRARNEDFYIRGILILSILLISAFIAPLVPDFEFWPVMGALLLALLPATQGAVDLVNNIVSALLKARALPKLDFSKGIPADATTLVVVPTLLLNETQVRELFDELEARYLANQDANLHFGLLTDLPDSTARPLAEDRNDLVELAVRITDELNVKYSSEKAGSFILLHRHRVFNQRQGVWMGWERKRGKLLDLNKLLLGHYDSFPVKAGPLDLLRRIRYVITLDSDTQLPRGTAARMIGTLAHPLNQAIVDPKLRIVTTGYGLLQPRVGVSVASASTSRLASLYSGETGFDIYTRAVSDVYQDLFGEGIFTGKGVYEVSILHQVLDRRFPRNALLSHDLIEGAYVRAGLVTDVEVIDDYPSHYSSHTRRKHRWVRGDWQIMQWIFGRVPDESGKMSLNPISAISRWKIFDNLRRSLVEPVTFLLLVCGWWFLPGGPRYWTIVTLILFLLPSLVQLGFSLGRAAAALSLASARDGFATFFSSAGFSLLQLAFLPHQMLLSIDAIVRSLIRSFVTGKRLLEWETAAQAESGQKKTSLDRYLQASPVVSIGIAALLAYVNPRALFAAGPILALWACAPAITAWLNSPPRKQEGPLPKPEEFFLREQALRIWRYFAEFGGEDNHWLIPDNVEEKNLFQVRKLSPTNLGMLINARQAAFELGLLTLPEFAHATLATLATYERLEKQRGHIYNWYDIESLQPIPPLIVSAVDSGNLAASLYALHSGALDLLKRPLFDVPAFEGVDLALRVAGSDATSFGRDKAEASDLYQNLEWLLSLPRTSTEPKHQSPRHSPEATNGYSTTPPEDSWYLEEAARRIAALSDFVTQYTPWLLPRFAPLFALPPLSDPDYRRAPPLNSAASFVQSLGQRLAESTAATSADSQEHQLALELGPLLAAARANTEKLVADLKEIATLADRYAHAMQYGFLLVESRDLLSIGYNGMTGELYSACYDLLASEARIATFLAVAKGDIPQRSWFRLDRSHVLVNGRAVLLSWTGTIFEYLMPALWMQTFPDTLISRSLDAAVRVQQEHVRDIPWGISESGFAKLDPHGRYGYQAWGIPKLALKYGAEDGPVISPYSTFLALPFARAKALANLHHMAQLNWTGAYGFYEAADYTQGTRPQMVRSWMAHHQGMSLLAITNLLRDNIFQRWFHAHPRVRAAELLLHERPLAKDTFKALVKHAESQAQEKKPATSAA